jgi:hypothetical protein
MFSWAVWRMDGSTTPRTGIPPWLDPTLIRLLEEVAAAEARRGTRPELTTRRVHEAAVAYRPALVLPQIREAVEIAL